jgi:hypothetical protein
MPEFVEIGNADLLPVFFQGFPGFVEKVTQK